MAFTVAQLNLILRNNYYKKVLSMKEIQLSPQSHLVEEMGNMEIE